jgi:hypothetical protein
MLVEIFLKKNASTVAAALASPPAWPGCEARTGPATKSDTAAQCGLVGLGPSCEWPHPCPVVFDFIYFKFFEHVYIH